MKNPIFVAALALAMVSGCGQIEKSERKQTTFTAQAAKVSDSEFAALCEGKPGRLELNGTVCIYESYKNELVAGEAYIDTSTDWYLTDIAAGSAVYATGEAKTNAVQIALNGNVISQVPSLNNRPVTTRGGKLSYRFQPGTVKGVRVYVYTCIDRNQKPINCPY